MAGTRVPPPARGSGGPPADGWRTEPVGAPPDRAVGRPGPPATATAPTEAANGSPDQRAQVAVRYDPRTGARVQAARDWREDAGMATPERPPEARPVASRPAGPRRARLYVSRLDPWSVMKSAFMISVAIAIVAAVSVSVLWWVLDVTGVFTALTRTVNDIVGTATTSFDLAAVLGFGRVMGVTLLLAAVEIVLVSALATLFAFLYNLTVGITGGLEVTLSEEG